MIYDFRKGASALFFNSLLKLDYTYDLEEFILSRSELQYDEIGYYSNSKKNGFVRLGSFLPKYRDVFYKRSPALHIFHCDTTEELGKRMKNTNSARNAYFSIDYSKDIVADLEICIDCAKHLKQKYKISMGVNTFNKFVLALEESDRTKQTITDKNGYIINWRQVSFCYRDFKRFTCEKCGYKAKDSSHYKFLHTHHIDGNKTNNKRSNLMCLCVRCHANVDQHHREKFALENLSLMMEFDNVLASNK